jgi:hypothetical protein
LLFNPGRWAQLPSFGTCFQASWFATLQIVNLFKSYFEGDLCENSVKNNFVLMYELLDEVCDYGFPQVTEPSILKSFIFQKGFRSEFLGDSLVSLLCATWSRRVYGGCCNMACKIQHCVSFASQEKKKEMAQNATLTVTGAVGWRREGIKYKKNEVFLDRIETVNLLMSANGEQPVQKERGHVISCNMGLSVAAVQTGCRAALLSAAWHARAGIQCIIPQGAVSLCFFQVIFYATT